MNKLVFTYGVMGCSKSAQVLISRYNYTQKGFNVVLLKTNLDNRNDNDKERKIVSRIGITAPCVVFNHDENILELCKSLFKNDKKNIVIIDEAQFCTKEQVNQLKDLARNVEVFCYGLKTNFKSEFFEGSKRLMEIADELREITSICKCGQPAQINARFINGKPTISGEEIVIAGDEVYTPLCYNCWKDSLNN